MSPRKKTHHDDLNRASGQAARVPQRFGVERLEHRALLASLGEWSSPFDHSALLSSASDSYDFRGGREGVSFVESARERSAASASSPTIRESTPTFGVCLQVTLFSCGSGGDVLNNNNDSFGRVQSPWSRVYVADDVPFVDRGPLSPLSPFDGAKLSHFQRDDAYVAPNFQASSVTVLLVFTPVATSISSGSLGKGQTATTHPGNSGLAVTSSSPSYGSSIASPPRSASPNASSEVIATTNLSAVRQASSPRMESISLPQNNHNVGPSDSGSSIRSRLVNTHSGSNAIVYGQAVVSGANLTGENLTGAMSDIAAGDSGERESADFASVQRPISLANSAEQQGESGRLVENGGDPSALFGDGPLQENASSAISGQSSPDLAGASLTDLDGPASFGNAALQSRASLTIGQRNHGPRQPSRAEIDAVLHDWNAISPLEAWLDVDVTHEMSSGHDAALSELAANLVTPVEMFDNEIQLLHDPSAAIGRDAGAGDYTKADASMLFSPSGEASGKSLSIQYRWIAAAATILTLAATRRGKKRTDEGEEAVPCSPGVPESSRT